MGGIGGANGGEMGGGSSGGDDGGAGAMHSGCLGCVVKMSSSPARQLPAAAREFRLPTYMPFDPDGLKVCDPGLVETLIVPRHTRVAPRY